MPNELKPEDVMKALELCNTPRSGVCKICPYHEFGASCHTKRNADALALLREKDAEIERLKSHINRLKKYDEERDIRLHARLTEKARADAITEVLNRITSNKYVVSKIHYVEDEAPTITYQLTNWQLAKIAKEMKGESDNGRSQMDQADHRHV